MAEFDAVLRKMSEEDIRETAAELLARLYPGKKSANRGEADNYESFEVSAFPEKAAEEHAAFSRLEHIDPERIRERRSFEAEEDHMPMSASENRSEGAEIIGRNEYEPMYAPMRLSRETDHAGWILSRMQQYSPMKVSERGMPRREPENFPNSSAGTAADMTKNLRDTERRKHEFAANAIQGLRLAPQPQSL